MKSTPQTPTPIPHLGCIVQPTPNGYFVNRRTDTSMASRDVFPTMNEALDFIEDVTKFEDE